nr:hypothetical protein [Phenylobacterium sp.]
MAQEGIAPLILLRLVAKRMAVAIHLDAQTSPCTVEVEHVWAERVLPSEGWLA